MKAIICLSLLCMFNFLPIDPTIILVGTTQKITHKRKCPEGLFFQLTNVQNQIGAIKGGGLIDFSENFEFAFDYHLQFLNNYAIADGISLTFSEENIETFTKDKSLGVLQNKPVDYKAISFELDLFNNGVQHNDASAPHLAIHKNRYIKDKVFEQKVWFVYKEPVKILVTWSAERTSFNLYMNNDFYTTIEMSELENKNMYWSIAATTNDIYATQCVCLKQLPQLISDL